MVATPPHSDPATARETINLRATAEQKALIDRAAQRLGKSRTEFMLDSAREAAENVLLDQRLFLADEAQYAAFLALLDAPTNVATVKKLLSSSAPWQS